ncbi:MAG: hypothetical protein ACKO14_00225 [Armatimonadota bacterium]
MIFNTITYFAAFLLPAALLIRQLPLVGREWLVALIGAIFFVTFSITSVGGVPGALCLGLLLGISLLCLVVLTKGSKFGLTLVLVAALATLAFFKYSNFFPDIGAGSNEAASPVLERCLSTAWNIVLHV